MSTVLIRHEIRGGRVVRCSKGRCVVEQVIGRYPADKSVKTSSGDVWKVEPAHSNRFDYVTVG